MTKFRPMPPGLAQRLIQGIRDELTPLAEERNRQISSMVCPRCRAPMTPSLMMPHPFTAEDPLPRTTAKCNDCGAEIDPRTGIVLSVGDARRVTNDGDLPLIDPNEYRK